MGGNRTFAASAAVYVRDKLKLPFETVGVTIFRCAMTSENVL